MADVEFHLRLDLLWRTEIARDAQERLFDAHFVHRAMLDQADACLTAFEARRLDLHLVREAMEHVDRADAYVDLVRRLDVAAESARVAALEAITEHYATISPTSPEVAALRQGVEADRREVERARRALDGSRRDQ